MEQGQNDDAVAIPKKPQIGHAKQIFIAGWVVAIIGMLIWTYALFVDGGPAVIDWASFSPSWIADMLPNWEAELGMVLSFIGTGPIYYVQIQQLRGRA